MDAAREKALQARIDELQGEIRSLRGQLPNPAKIYQRVHQLLQDGCNTSRDIADELNIPVYLAGAHLFGLRKRGLARRTGRVIRQDDCRNPLTVWEAL